MNLWGKIGEWWQKKRDRDAAGSGIALRDRLEAADYFLAYAARKKIVVNVKDIVPKLTRAAATLKPERPLTEVEATDFWTAYTELATAIAPVTADSIMASGAYFRTGSGKLARGSAGKWFGRWAFGALVALIIVQMYWLIGSNLVGEIDRLEGEINSAIITLVATNNDGGNTLGALYPVTDKGITPPLHYCIGDSKSVDSDNIIVRRNVVKFILEKLPTSSGVSAAARPTEGASQIKPAEALTQLKIAEKKAPTIDLERVCILAHKIRVDLVYDQLKTWAIPINWMLLTKDNDTALSVNKVLLDDQTDNENVKHLRTARLSIEILSKYILPLLYGFLGACTFVVRKVSAEVKLDRYSRASATGYWLRMLLGLVAGLSAAWFLNPLVTGAEQKTIAAISPLALAFLAGYSVELVFTAMDRLISAFTNDPADRAAEKTS